MEDQALKKEREELIAKAIKSGSKSRVVLTPDIAEAMSIEDLRAEYGEPPEKEKEAELDGLMAMSFNEIEDLTVKAMREICKEHEMSTDGKKPELLDRVCAIRFGRIKRYIGAETRCAICGAEVMVKGKKTEPMADGRTLVTRSIKCKDRHAHTYPLKDIV